MERLLKEGLAAFGLLAAIGGLVDVFFPDTFEGHGLPAVLVVCVLAVSFGLYRSWPRPIEHCFTAPNTVIRIVRGDLFGEDGHIVVGACDTFDTEVPRVISPRSVQGQLLSRLYGNDVGLLDRDLDVALEGATPTDHVQKYGKQSRYEIGTVAAVPQAGRQILFLAYTKMNEHNEARGTTDGIWKSLLSLWSAVSRCCNGQPVAVPVIGGGQARISQILPAQDAIRFIAFSFILASRQERICDELRIVVHPNDYNRLDRLELQAFLDSLESRDL
ncbi:macro domain-containing protein [Baekduia sp. Peel2402]|uniref:macro domain-containing protein n=1 Tax=Baekduia sp. Peel2402 TaxID=3458296 RepID=UPI00403E43C3